MPKRFRILQLFVGAGEAVAAVHAKQDPGLCEGERLCILPGSR